ncbi:S1 family peptidase [Jidongwangia harbinensis]|uniref:S1 family peptidase n=1 Tax=Jidongwangia harbinensis TaxID=2878561 RepID=UPI001CD91A7E|nr:serine protease [Jidongwangia harbinensis]MCA2211641.1 serine protease [Jidongwangia harbinensis]
MTDTAWRARIAAPVGGGSGFLVDDRHVVTCDHVVRGHSAVRVFLDDGAVRAEGTVLGPGEWCAETAAAGDVAVVELTEPVTGIAPARLASFAALTFAPDEELSAFAVVQDYPDGVNVKFTANPAQKIGRNLQVEPVDNRPVWIKHGFSGAAACRRDATVAGMVKATAAKDQVGMIIPTRELVRHSPKLDDLIGLGLLGPPAYQALRRTIAACRLSPDQVSQLRHGLRQKVPDLPGHLDSLLDLVESLVVQTGNQSQQEMEYHLAGLLLWLGTPEAHEWGSRWLWEGLVARTPGEAEATDRMPEVQTVIEAIERAVPEPPPLPPPAPPVEVSWPGDGLAARALRLPADGVSGAAVYGFAVDRDTAFVPGGAVRESPVRFVTATGEQVVADVLAIPEGEVAVLGLRHPVPAAEPLRWGRFVVHGSEVAGDVLGLPGNGSPPVTMTSTVRGSHDRRDRYWLGPGRAPICPGSPVRCAGRWVGFVAADGQSVVPAAVAVRQAWEAGALPALPAIEAIEFVDHEMSLPPLPEPGRKLDATASGLREWTAGVGGELRRLEHVPAAALAPLLHRLRGAGWTVLAMTPAEVRQHWSRISTAIANVMVVVDGRNGDADALPPMPVTERPSAPVLRLLVLT